jgi:hypothetical protein
MIPSLDTLDISCNEITHLPAQPDRLFNLRVSRTHKYKWTGSQLYNQVFCISKNKLARLPSYLPQLHRLAVLEIERNPIEWPPKSVLDRPSKFDSPDQMKEWIRGVQRWIETEMEVDDEELYVPCVMLFFFVTNSLKDMPLGPISHSQTMQGKLPTLARFQWTQISLFPLFQSPSLNPPRHRQKLSL